MNTTTTSYTAIKSQFFKYVSQNILGMIGMSLYILADTFFISKSVGSDGITALNLVLPVYSLIFAIGSMIGVGSAIRFSIERNKYPDKKSSYFVNALFWGTVIGLIFTLLGLFVPGQLVGLLGGDLQIIAVGKNYVRIFMLFGPCFIWNYICNAFVRNDGSPSIAMAATLFSSLFNIVFDYVLMFPCGLGMEGAALATACSPLVGVAICCIHFFSKKNTISFKIVMPSIRMLFSSCQVGVAAFVGEISSGVITMVFNLLILGIAGNIGVAAYGVIANTALVAVSVFNGVAQGSQPLLSTAYGKKDQSSMKTICRLGLSSALILAGLILCFVFFQAETITSIFNSEHNEMLTSYATNGLRIYFTGFLFAGINIVGTSILSSVAATKWAFSASILRGFVAIIFCALILSRLFGLTGVWLAFPVAELITSLVTLTGIRRSC